MNKQYQEDADLQRYVNAIVKTRNLPVNEVLRLRVVKEYAEFIKEQKRGKYDV